MSETPESRPRPLTALTPPEAARALADDPRLLLGVASLDPLGQEIALGGMVRIVDAVVRRVSAVRRLVHAPTFYYGGVTGAGRSQAGTAGLQRKTLHRAINDLLGAWEDHGVSEFVLVTALRSEPHMDALLMAFTSEARTTVFDLLSLDISDMAEAGSLQRPGQIEARVLAHLDSVEKYTGGATATPSTSADPAGGSILERWVALLTEAIPAAGPAPPRDV